MALQITINIENEEELKELTEKGIKSLTEDDLKNVVIEGIRECIKASNYEIVRNLLIRQVGSYYDKQYAPTTFLNDIIQDKCDYSELQTIVDKMIEYLKVDYKDILVKLLSNILSYGLSKKLFDGEEIQHAINDTVMKMKEDNII